MDSQHSAQKKLLLVVTGSVAAIKVVEIVEQLIKFCQLKVVLTSSTQATRLVTPEQIQQVSALAPLYTDQHQYQLWKKRGDPVLHIELRKWADALLIAPLSANTLAKIANGICDTLATLVCRCWDFSRKESSGEEKAEEEKRLLKPIWVCPAMNSLMWDHPVTGQHLGVLREWGYEVVGPVVKTLMCGEVGAGGMSRVEDIVEVVGRELWEKKVE